MDVSLWSDIATIIAAVIAVIALSYTTVQVTLAKQASRATAYQVELAEKTSRGQLWLQLRQLFINYDEIHIKLRPNGEWYASDSKPTNADMPKVEVYMGLFEHCERLLEDGLLDPETFESIYAYRLQNIVVNRRIRKAKLIDRWNGWKDFLSLLYRFRHRIEEIVPEEQDPRLWEVINRVASEN